MASYFYHSCANAAERPKTRLSQYHLEGEACALRHPKRILDPLQAAKTLKHR